jgi:hypothetical protein
MILGMPEKHVLPRLLATIARSVFAGKTAAKHVPAKGDDSETKKLELPKLPKLARKPLPERFQISSRVTPARLMFVHAFLSADVQIEGVSYGLHAYIHPTAKLSAHPDWLYFAVTGPGTKGLRQGEFEITDKLRWTGGRPLNAVPVKAALRQWLSREEVQQCIEEARSTLPVERARNLE